MPDAGQLSGAEVIQAAITHSVSLLEKHLRGPQSLEDPEAIHQSRVSLRRLRSDLRTFGPLVEAEWAAGLIADMKELSAELGAVRDNDVLQVTLATAIAELPEVSWEEARPVFDHFEGKQKQNRERLLTFLESESYATLITELHAAAGAPGLRSKAHLPAAEVLPLLMRKPWKRLTTAVKDLGDAPADRELHRVRILAKRCRYGAEALRPVAGKPARVLAKAIARVQDTLGVVNDAVLIGTRLQEASAQLPEIDVAAGRLEVWLHVRAAQARARWRSDWERASRQALRFW